MKRFFVRLVDYFYIPQIKKFVPLHTFRYAIVGGLNLALNSLIYFLSFHFLLRKTDTLILGFVTISAPVMAFGVTLIITSFTGFWLTRAIAFGGTKLRGRTQMFRYYQIVLLNVLINYFGIKLLVEALGFYPTPSNLLLQMVTVVVSYTGAKYYIFR